jgi:hypothetical protein
LVLRRGLLFVLLGVSTLAVSVLVSCQGSEDVLLCGEIPLHGCPAGRGGSCTDETCAALYDCVDGAWTAVQTCSFDGGVEQVDGPDGACEQAELDAGVEVTGCHPDLQVPDCPVAAARTCVESACLTDCVDFFACSAAGWKLVAYCDEEGHVVLEP